MIESDLVILLTLLLSAFFSGMEIAFVSSNRIYLEIEKLQGSYTSKVLKNITKKPSRFIASMLLGNNIALVVYGIFTGDRILQLFFPETLLSGGDPSLIVILYQTLISTAVILITAEFLPKVFFQLYANLAIKIFAIPVALFYYLFYPITYLIIQFTDVILKRFLKTDSEQVQLSFSKVELGNYIEEQLESTHDKESLDSEIQIFQKALDFSDVKAKEAMVPRAEVVAVDEDTPIDEIKALFISTGFSKIPVFQKNIDQILGYVHVFDMMKSPKTLKNILLPLAYVPETMLINDVLKLLTRQHKSISVVIDEHGGISGILTVEDIVEELFGEIEDEYDTVEHIEKQLGETTFDFSARLEVDYLNQRYNLSLPESEFYETLGGLIAYHIGEIPQKGEKIEIPPYALTIKKVSATKIEEILLERFELD
ncbi:hemolysin family protein [Flavobacteriaceae bacterium]|jgi:CBS domain containing-hemolysin-like protein|nr:hemolysin family protein [Flavobacteriaceae bacterium]MDA8644229.1 hemolysin family protein [Flavobacteriaceae bacterium]MDA8877042.1 hemolysin family protein [Flavobacteriaceae bacterium]MDA9038193.1 hemolysin family protein [Flavobacteriaceae bacterium]MDA9851314.1 hemolysin family protein [Flavobacteriaceae bacterium]